MIKKKSEIDAGLKSFKTFNNKVMSSDKLEETNIDLALMKENRRILLVDDEPYNIMGMKIVLHQSGIKNLMQFVDIAYNGQ